MWEGAFPHWLLLGGCAGFGFLLVLSLLWFLQITKLLARGVKGALQKMIGNQGNGPDKTKSA